MNKAVIIALDFNNKAKVERFLAKFSDEKLFLKVGMELFLNEGRAIIDYLKDLGHQIFLDLKLHDIPKTVDKTLSSLKTLDVDIIDVHIAGGSEMLSQATEVFSDKKTLVIGITQLTSTNQQMLNEQLLINQSMERTVLSYTKMGIENGLDGVVCSALEVMQLKDQFKNIITVVPGIRRAIDQIDDQSRIVSPKEAKMIGCDFIVVGRPITKSQNPYASYQEIKNEFIN